MRVFIMPQFRQESDGSSTQFVTPSPQRSQRADFQNPSCPWPLSEAEKH
jgi:hypothetical protein